MSWRFLEAWRVYWRAVVGSGGVVRRGFVMLWRARGITMRVPSRMGVFWARLGTARTGQCRRRLGQGQAWSASGGSGEGS
jgi:hypothetical protein